MNLQKEKKGKKVLPAYAEHYLNESESVGTVAILCYVDDEPANIGKVLQQNKYILDILRNIESNEIISWKEKGKVYQFDIEVDTTRTPVGAYLMEYLIDTYFNGAVKRRIEKAGFELEFAVDRTNKNLVKIELMKNYD